MEQITRKIIQIGTLGDWGVGKSNLSSVFAKNEFSTEHLSTIGINCLIKNIKIKIGNQEKEIKVKIWDTAGQEKFKSISIQYVKNCLGIILVYSILDSKTLENIDNWINEIKEKKNNDKVFMVLIGNKCDLEDERVVSKKEGEKFANKHNLKLFECSAKKRINVNEAFDYLINGIVDIYKDEFIENNNNDDEEKKDSNEKKGNCCKSKKNKKNNDLKLNVRK